MSTRRDFMFKVAPVVTLGTAFVAVSPAAANADTVEIDEPGLHEAAEYIESIPDSALESDEAYEKWKKDHPVLIPRGPVACAAAATIALGSTLFVGAKVLKIKSAIKAAGGAKKFADLLITGFKVAKAEGKSNSAALEFAAKEAAQTGGKDVVVAILDLISVKDVATDCFGIKL